MAEIDHIVVGASTLAEGADYIEQQLGARPTGGGQHEGQGTHNLVLGLGPDRYLEVIAADPGQPAPEGPRPFGLDDPAVQMVLEAGPRLMAWVARTPALEAVAARLGPAAGEVKAWSRGALTWSMAVPAQRSESAIVVPALIQWDDGAGAAPTLPDSGCRLAGLEAEVPDVDAVRGHLAQRGLEDALTLRPGSQVHLVARLVRADGQEVALRSA